MQFERTGVSMKWICANCGYVYDVEKGDPLNGVAPGVRFEDLPEGWVCPLCYAGREAFDVLG